MKTHRRTLAIVIAACIVIVCACILARAVYREATSRLPDIGTAMADRDVSINSILAGYKANVDRFPTLRVTWRSSIQYLPAWFAQNDKQAAGFEQHAAETGVNSDLKTSLLQQARQARAANKYNREASHSDYDFWTDGRAFQVRIPRPGSKNYENPKFADDPVSPESLANAFASTCIFSWSPAQSGSLRTWYGIDARDGTGQASISDTNIKQSIVNFQFPPYGVRDDAWGDESMRHPVDQFFIGVPSEYQIVRTESLKESKTIVVDRIRIRTAPEGMDTQSGKLELMECMRAWIDPARGFLPVRVELRTGWRLNGRALGNPENWKPIWELDLPEIAIVAGAYYPKRCTLTAYCADPALKQNANDIDGLIAGSAADLITVPYQQTVWTASTIEAQRPMPASMFISRFPDNTDVADATRPSPPVQIQLLKLGDAAPEWKVAGWTDGRARKLGDFRGKIVLLDFWGVWCGPCLQGLPAIETVQRKYRDDVVCLEIHTAGAEISKVRDMLASKGVNAPSAIDEGTGRNGATSRLYGVEGWPHLVLIDRNGNIAWTSHDPDNETLMADAASAAGIAWPPKDAVESDLLRLHAMAISMQIDKVLRLTERAHAR